MKRLVIVATILLLLGACGDDGDTSEPTPEPSPSDLSGHLIQKPTDGERWIWCLEDPYEKGHGGGYQMSCDWVDYHHRYPELFGGTAKSTGVKP